MAVLRVSNQSELDNATEDVRSGDTILLEAGTYAELNMQASQWNANLRFTSKVTIASADAGRPAVLNKMVLRDMANVELRDLKFDYVPSKTADDPFWIEAGRNVVLRDSTFEGETRSGFGAGIGLRIKNSDDVTVDNVTISNFRNGLYATGSTQVDVLNSDFRKMANDGILMGGMNNVLIQGNDFRDPHSPTSLQHKDNIQFYTGNGEPGSSNVTVRNNVIDNPEATHGIYFTNSAASDGNLSIKHRNILIEDNSIRSAHTHGITVNHGDGIVIRDNTIRQNPDEGRTETINVPRIHVSTLSNNVTITGNQVASVQAEANSTWNISGNDTARQMSHWIGVGATIGPNREPSGGGGGGANGQEFRLDGRDFDDASVTFEGVDFGDGDELVFNFFDTGTFRQVRDSNPVDVWDDGKAVKIDSVKDLIEVVERSVDVWARTVDSGDRLILTIDQNAGQGTLSITGMGDAYDNLL